MTVAQLKSLSLTAFRGSSTTFKLNFEKKRKLTIIYGENGMGKTTICDGLEFLALGDVGSLNDKGLGGGLEKHWPAKGKAPTDIAVNLEYNDNSTCAGRVVGKDAQIVPPGSRPRIALLRQQQIKRLVEATAGERYKALESFIDVASFEKSEATLRKLVDQLKSDKKSAAESEVGSFQAIQDYYKAAGSPPGQSALVWAEQIVSAPKINTAPELNAVQTLRSAWFALRPFPDAAIMANTKLVAAEVKLAEAQSALTEAVVAVSETAVETVSLLELGQTFLHAHPEAEVCPLCELPQKGSDLLFSINKRLNDLKAVQTAQQFFIKCKSDATSAAAEAEKVKSNIANAKGAYENAVGAFQWPSHYDFPATKPPEEIEELRSWLGSAEQSAITWANAEGALTQGAKEIAALSSALERHALNTVRKTEVEALLPKVDEALELCKNTRMAFTDKIMAEIATTVGELYELVHRGEGHDKIALQLDPKQRASVKMAASFSGTDVPPAAYFSQSHLDTLGLCVFLALALKDGPEQKILILDDVLGSIDEPHVERVISMIYEVSKRFRHTIVTTHYRPWREKYRWGRLSPEQPCQFVELATRRGDGSMRIKGTLPETQRLRLALDGPEPDLQAICSKAGVILEEALDYLTIKYECTVPRKLTGAYTLGELLPAISDKLRVALKVQVRELLDDGSWNEEIVELKPILDEISTLSAARNLQGAHFNQLSFDLLDEDGLRFGELVHRLASSIVCPEFGWPGKRPSGSYWQNGGQTRYLHPLQRPS